ncbi:hypothetical protein, partial [Thiolapillus sp.]
YMNTTHIITNEAIEYLNRELVLPSTGREQDWEIELADSNRINEFISFYENKPLSDDKKFALMALIIGSLENLAYIKSINKDIWGKVARLLCARIELYKPLIDYWSLVGEDNNDDDTFAITKLMRSLKCC